jgi:hypothetical protein
MEIVKENIDVQNGSTHFQQFALQAGVNTAPNKAAVASGIRRRLATAIQRSNSHVRQQKLLSFLR